MADADLKWVATLSDGTTVAEHTGAYAIVPGERKPWVRLCEFLATEGLHLTSLRLNFRGRTIHLPRSKFDRFGIQNLPPLFYSLQYHIEGVMNEDGSFTQELFIDLAAHYDVFVVHYIQNVSEENTSWVVVSDSYNAPAATPNGTNRRAQ